KNITGNEWACEGSEEVAEFPQTLLVEAAAQAAIVLYHVSKNLPEEYPDYIAGKMHCRLESPVYIGSELIINVRIGNFLRSGGYVFVFVEAESKEALSMEFFFSVKR
ncbi:MAG: hypothetical protein NT079_01360, partial [Candidatus Omnitrophica bacterium]|nr:hypothetical protein [Candidatus Omnitrophota bacterium]